MVNVNARNIDDLFRRARRTFGDAAAKWYWDGLCDEGMDPDAAKVKVAALADNPSVGLALQVDATTLINAWRTQHNGAISTLPDAKRAQFYKVWQQAKAPTELTMIMPDQVTASDLDTRYPKHVYANGNKTFPVKLNDWERPALLAELARESIGGWYRNSTGGTSALAVPYKQSGVDRTMYPDFLFFHVIAGQVAVDLVDPHRPSEADTGPKWSGLAAYAKKHGHRFRRVVAVIKDDHDQLLSIDLKDPNVANAMANASNETDIRKAFADYGGPY